MTFLRLKIPITARANSIAPASENGQGQCRALFSSALISPSATGLCCLGVTGIFTTTRRSLARARTWGRDIASGRFLRWRSVKGDSGKSMATSRIWQRFHRIQILV